jgi:hypothetical protein
MVPEKPLSEQFVLIYKMSTIAINNLVSISNGFVSVKHIGIDLTDAWVYLNASAQVGFTDGNPVSIFDDTSGNNNDASQGTGTMQPIYHTGGPNGKAYVSADGVNDIMSFPALNIPSGNKTFFFVVRLYPYNDATARFLFDSETGRLTLAGWGTATPTQLAYFDGSWHGLGEGAAGWHVLIYRLGSSGEIIADGFSIGTDTYAAKAISGATRLFGPFNGDTTNIIKCDLAEFAGYTRALTDIECVRLLEYARNEYDLTRYRIFYNGGPSLNAYKIGGGLAYRGSGFTGIEGTRIADNPRLSPGSGGAWDDEQAKDPFALYDSGFKMWYAGHDGSNWRIGYATSPDGFAWTKSASNPVIDLGGSGTFDQSGCIFPVVYKDPNADASKRYRMLYSGINTAGKTQIGYAYSANGISWTKGGSNPVLTNGSGGSVDDEAVIVGSLVKDAGVYYLFYEGRGTTVFPTDGQPCLATFTDFEGVYTKSGLNPVLSRRTGNQALASNLSIGGTSVEVASSSVFVVGEVVCLVDTPNNVQQTSIASIPDSTHVVIDDVARINWTTANGSRLQTILRAIFPRAVIKEGGVWKMWATGYQVGVADAQIESTYYIKSNAPDSGWSFQHDDSSPLFLPDRGATGKWDSRSSENIVFVLDADTNTRYLD